MELIHILGPAMLYTNTFLIFTRAGHAIAIDPAADPQKYLDELRSSIDGNVNQDVSVTQDSKILTLSTCISEYPNQRWLVNATLADEK